MKSIYLIVGLGNPSSEYEKTFHNVGHLMVDFLGRGIKSETFMNKSGEFVKQELKKAKAKPENLLVIHDDSDIELGKFKFSFGRNSAGHKGVQNIIDQLKTKFFWRLRIGIRPVFTKTPAKREKADQLVLKEIKPAQMELLQATFKEAVEQLK